ncbi:MAG: hypothetical protein QOC68_276 [Solirubrobacteraceae bacterium]|jgi:hypothetical protein|nr:hypothetical protein [Solirubrobacteraceae bacterium]
MPERPKPDIDHTREALRQHDERVEEDQTPEEQAPDETEPVEGDGEES